MGYVSIHFYFITAMIHTGLGPKQVGSFFSTMNVPPISVKALKTREREIGRTVEKKADETCRDGIQQEIMLMKYFFFINYNIDTRDLLPSCSITIFVSHQCT